MIKQLVYDFLKTIPKGKVVTYSSLAASIGHPGAARAVGNILHVNPDPDTYPCFRVVNARGCVAEHFGLGKEEQIRRLENDGIKVVNGKVDLTLYLWEIPGRGFTTKSP